MTNDGRISLSDSFQFSLFREAMNTMNRRKTELSWYDLVLYRKLRDGWDLARRDLTLTVKQLNHLKQVAIELDSETYRGRPE